MLIQISLAVTFAGLAAILVNAGDSIAEIVGSAANASNIVNNPSEVDQDVSGPVLEILTTAGSKFWITAFAYSIGLILLLYFYAGEKIWKRSLAKFGKAIEAVLESECAQEYARSADGNVSTKDKNTFQKILTDNAENIANVGKEVNDRLIEKLGRIAQDVETVSESILLNVNNSFEELRSTGITVNIQNSFTTTVADLMKHITDEVSYSSRQIEELNANIRDFVEAANMSKSGKLLIKNPSSTRSKVRPKSKVDTKKDSGTS